MTEREMRAYLLGQAAAADAERLEVRLLEDEDVYATLRGVEDDLFDEYASGSLTEEERQQFLERYGTERPRLLVAHALAARIVGRTSRYRGRSDGAGCRLQRRRSWWSARAWRSWMRSAPEDGSATADHGRERSVQSLAAPVVMNLTLGTSRSASSAARGCAAGRHVHARASRPAQSGGSIRLVFDGASFRERARRSGAPTSSPRPSSTAI